LNAALALAAGRRELRRVTWRHGTGKHAQSDRGDDFLTALDQAICTRLRHDPKASTQSLAKLQTLLATWTGACHTCQRPYPDTT
jgi:hypothetical protein